MAKEAFEVQTSKFIVQASGSIGTQNLWMMVEDHDQAKRTIESLAKTGDYFNFWMWEQGTTNEWRISVSVKQTVDVVIKEK